MKPAKIISKLYSLCGACSYVSKENYKNSIENGFTSKKLDQVKEIHELFDTIEYTETKRQIYWMRRFHEQGKLHMVYRKKPIRERKDNKDFYNGGGYGENRNRIRYPKKCRKTAWKRFYKLFPKLNPLNKQLES